MNSYERTWARLEGKPVDRLPALPIFMMYACNLIGRKYSDFVKDHRVMVEANMAMVERYGIDMVSCCSDPFAEAADCGAVLEYFENQPPACREHLLHGPEDLARLKQPDPHGGGRMTERLKAIELYRQRVGGSVPIQGWVEGPLAQAADLRGLNELLLETATEPGFVGDLMDWIVEMEIRFARAQIEAGASLIGMGDAAASLVSPKFYAAEIAPREKRIIDAIHKAGAKVRLHICGKLHGKYAAIATLGVDLLDVDYFQSIEEVRRGVGPGPCLAGNIDPVRQLKDSNPDQIHLDFAKSRTEAGEKYIVAAGCEIPPGTPEENVKAMFSYAQSAR